MKFSTMKGLKDPWINTKENFDMVRQFIGYCPQENALFSHFTVHDALYFYCQLKGWVNTLRQ